MTEIFEQRINKLAAIPSDVLWNGLIGIEKESLRVRPDGYLSDRPHPKSLGSALTNRLITTDFSEALLEFTTPPFLNTWEVLRFLCDIHQFSYDAMGDELLWATSMPCRISEDRKIPIAYYGESNIGRMKTIYRNGLSYRYGRVMQTIAGIHFNYSLPTTFWPIYMELEQSHTTENEFRSDAYLGLVRNFHRFGWLVLYLFGGSPAVCKSFGGDVGVGIESLNCGTFYTPFGTSLRMSDLGYNSHVQTQLDMSINNLDDYISDLDKAITTPELAYQTLGLKENSEYKQLSVNQLQIENEYYSPIRPKSVAFSEERPTAALRRSGIEYVEIRSLDINVFDPVGINQNTMRFMEVFLIYCLLKESPPFAKENKEEAVKNHTATAKKGRDPSLKLQRDKKNISLSNWATEILRDVRMVAELIEKEDGPGVYVHAVDTQLRLVSNSELTPSARILTELRATGTSFFEFAMACTLRHKKYFADLVPLAVERNKEFSDEAAESIRRQCEIEGSDAVNFEEYLKQWFVAD